MIDAYTLADLEARVKAADARYGTFASTHEALGVALEEFQELTDAVRSNVLQDVASEALDLAAVCIRLAMQIEDPRLAMRSVK
jgi:NTP pyrophosphatase (non-canonical NTP hydrolase)